MGVPGAKLLDDERFTQDMLGVSPPTFVTPDTRSNAQLQHWSSRTRRSSTSSTSASPTSSTRSCSCSGRRRSPARSRASTSARALPARRGPGDAVLVPAAAEARTRIPRLPLRPPDNYLRVAMAETLAERDVEFDILLQVQTDPFLMPIENAAVLWPTKLSPRVPAAVLRIPSQTLRLARAAGLRRASSPTTPGTACPSTGRWATRAAPAGGCTGSCRGCASG